MQYCIGIMRICVVDYERFCSRNSVWEIEAAPILKQQVGSLVGWINFCVIIFDEASGSANQIQAHQLTPVVQEFALLKCSYRSNRTLEFLYELAFAADIPNLFFWSNSDV